MYVSRCSHLLIITLVILAMSLPCSAQASLEVDLTIAAPAAESATIKLQLADLPSGTEAVTMFMGREFSFTRTVDPAVLRIEAANERGDSLTIARSSVNTWRIETAGASSLRVEYDVGLTQRQHPDVVANRNQYEWPYVADDHGLLYTAAMLMLPRELDLDLTRLTVRIHPPAGWDVIAPWPRNDDGAFQPSDLNSFLNDYVAIGAWQQTVARIGDFTATIAIAPGQERTVRAAIRPIRRIVEYELELFDWDQPGKFLFCFGRPDAKGAAGSPKANSMTLMVAPDEDPQRALEKVSHLVAHEFFHLWASSQIARMPDDLRFFNEGFTEYYAWLVSARLGLISWERFAEAIGESVRRCEQLKPARMSLVQAGGPAFFHDEKATRLVYDGGLLMAALLDMKVRTRGDGRTLDDFMQEFLNDERWNTLDDNGDPRIPDLNTDFRRVMGRYIDEPAWVIRYLSEIGGTWTFRPERMFGEIGIAIEQVEVPRTIEFGGVLKANLLTGVTAGLGASQLELCAGDVILECNGRSVETPEDLAAAWAVNPDGRISMRYRRDGEVFNVSAQLPREMKFVVPSEPWRE